MSGLSLEAQQKSTSRITRSIDDHLRVALKGNVHPLAQARFDRGAVPASFAADRMFLLLERPPDREFALRQFLLDAHRQGSAAYHKWLTPEKFAELYGPDDTEIAAVAAWLQTEGFSVSRITRGKSAIEFSGTAGQIRGAFHTEIHAYAVNGEEHYANNADPQIPAALADVIAGITPLNDFRPRPYVKDLGRAVYDTTTHRLTPQWTFPAGNNLLDLGPSDFAVQYDLNPLYQAGVKGKGVTIGIIGASNVDPAVVATYRTFFGLPENPLNVVIDGNDPGENSAFVESYLDVEEAGAVAPEANVTLYTAADTWVQSGLILAAQRAVDDDAAPVLSTSYGVCEQELGSSGNYFWASLWEQAAAQGQTSLVSSGDGGPAGCDNFNMLQAAQYGNAVSGFTSTPWNVSVGGTDFLYGSYSGTQTAQETELGSDWILTPSWMPATSLMKPVSEQPWNDPFGLNLTSGGVYDPTVPTIVGASGGPSNCATGVAASDGTYASCSGGYPKPAWQSGNGVPADSVRDIPDVSLFAAAGENDTFYPICVVPGECEIVDGALSITVVGGTSASSPAMAGIMALVNQKYGPQGQANFVLYPLAAQHPAAFHDITQGSNVVPCQVNTPDCAISTANDNTKGFYALGYDAGPGYDLATGLGSVDANALVTYWNALKFKSTSTTLSFSATTFTHGTPVNVNVAVTGSGGQPSGDVALVGTATAAASAGLGQLTLNAGAASSSLSNLPGGQYQVTAKYSGDSLFATSSSQPQTLNITPENSLIALSGTTYIYGYASTGSLSNGGSYPYGTYVSIDAQSRGVNAPAGSTDGIATGTMTFSDTAGGSTGSSGALALNHQGVAQWTPSAGFPVGAHSVSASYSGDASFNAASSASPLNFTITKATPGIQLFGGGNSSIGAGQNVTLQATLAVSPYVAAPTGQVTFHAGATNLGSAALGPLDFYSSGASVANLTTNLLTNLGPNSVTATYAGDSNYSSVTSNAVTVNVMQPAGVTASVSPHSVNAAQNFTVSATLSGVNDQPAPTGGIFFYAYGAGGSWSAPGTLANGAWSFTFPAAQWLPGTVQISATFSGDTVYAPVTATVPVTITAPFAIAATTASFQAGATSGNTSTVTITPENGFTGTVYLSCSLMSYPNSAQHLAACSVPSSVNVTGTAAVTAAMSITSTPPTTTAWTSPHGGWFAANAATAMAAFGLVGISCCDRRKRKLKLLSILFLLAVFAGCGSGGGNSGGGGGGGGQKVGGTTPGTYTFMVQAHFTADPSASQPVFTTVTVTIQ